MARKKESEIQKSNWLELFLEFIGHLTIDSKELVGGSPLNLYGSQQRFLAELVDGLERDIHTFVCLKAMQLGMCLDPSHRVLTADLTWKKISDLKIGDELVSTDEVAPIRGRGNDRKLRTCRVEAIKEVNEPAVDLTMDNGLHLVATNQHRFLSQARGGKQTQWRTVEKTKIGDVIRYVTSPWDGMDYEDGWFSGLIDGEGSMRQKDRAGVECCVCQVPGEVLDRARYYLSSRGYSYREEINKNHNVVNKTGSVSSLGTKDVHKLVIGRLSELFRLIGQTRPSRFIKMRWWEGKSLPGKKIGTGWSRVVDIKNLPSQKMIDLQTSTGTFIVEGFVSHNSTLALAIDLFWLAVHPGMQGLLLTDTDGNRQKFRIILKRYVSSLPKSYAIKIIKGGDNREHMVFSNGSVLDFIVAGTRQTATEIGRSRAYNFAHITEIANYGALEGVVSLLDRLAEKHPNRLYVIESTAKGYNLFYEIWNKAKQNPETQKAFFIGWWSKDDYSIPEDSPLFKKYWDGSLDDLEQERINTVWEKYGVRITPQQIVWYRWKYDMSSETSLMDQNFPWDEEDAFLQTGQTFFPIRKTVALVKSLSENLVPFKGYAYDFCDRFMDTNISSVRTADEAQLKIYEDPSEIGWYAMGVDPAYGRSENQDRTVVQVCRCYADKFVQVAEFASPEPQSHQCAWVMAHLAGIYKNVMMIVEITGPGEATVLEVNHLRQLFDANALPIPGNGEITDIFGSARWFMYHRQDSPGAGFQWNWKTTSDNKLAILNELRDSLTTGLVEIRSISAALEIQSMVQRGFVIEPALTTQKDDRVFGLAFAHRAWTQWIRPMMIDSNDTWERVMKREASMSEGSHSTMMSKIISDFFQGKVEDREEQEIQQAWDD